MVDDQRRKQKEHGAQSDQGGRTTTEPDAPKPAPRVWEGGEESNQQRRS